MTKLIVILGVVLSFLLSSCKNLNPSEPEESVPQELKSDILYTGEISTKGEIDHYLYKPTSDQYIHIVCSEAVQYSNFNPYIRLLDYNTKHVFGSATSYTQAVITNQYVEAGKTYEGLVQEWSDDETGGYTLLIDIDTDDEKPLVMDQEINGKIDYVRDVDEFILNINEIGYYHIIVREKTPYSEFNPHISLLDYPTKYRLDEQTSYTEAVLVNENLGQNPSYWVRVQEWSDDQAGNYVITYMKDADDSVTFTSTPVYYEGKIDFVRDMDKFYFEPYWSGDYKFVLAEKTPNSEYNPHLKILGQYNNELYNNAAYDSVVTNKNLDASEYYKIEVREWSNDQAGEYILKIEYQ